MALAGFIFQFDGNAEFYTFAETSAQCPCFNSVLADFVSVSPPLTFRHLSPPHWMIKEHSISCLLPTQ